MAGSVAVSDRDTHRSATVALGGVQLAQYNVSSASGNQADDSWRVFNFNVTAARVITITPLQTLQAGNQFSVF